MYKILFTLLGFVTFIVVSPMPAEAAAGGSMLADAKTGLSVTTDDRILGKSGRSDHYRRIRLAYLSALRSFRK